MAGAESGSCHLLFIMYCVLNSCTMIWRTGQIPMGAIPLLILCPAEGISAGALVKKSGSRGRRPVGPEA